MLEKFLTSVNHEHSGGFIASFLEYIFVDLFGISENIVDIAIKFLSEILNISFILLLVIFLLSLLQTYIPFSKLKNFFLKFSGIGGMIAAIPAAMLSPFCCCTIVPIILGFISVGVPVTTVVVYLLCALTINFNVILSLSIVVGWKYTLIYLVTSIIMSMFVSMIVKIFQSSMRINFDVHFHNHEMEKCGCSFSEKLLYSVQTSWSTLKSSFIYIVIGISVSLIISNLLPINFIIKTTEQNEFLSIAAVSITGVFLHSDIFSILPIITMLTENGIQYSIINTFIMASMAVSIPTLILLKKIISFKSLIIFVGITLGSISIIGFIFSIVI